MWPENTLTAFQGAVDLGVRYLETDLRLSADGVLMCFHDSYLDRTTDARGPLRGLTADQLTKVDAGFRFRVGDQYPHRGVGCGVPTLQQVVTALPDPGLVLDMKEEGLEEPLAEFLRQHKLEHRVIVGSFVDARVARFRELTGNRVATSSPSAETKAIIVASRRKRESGSPALAVQLPQFWRGVPVVTPRLVAMAHAEGKKVHVWTINHPVRMSLLLRLGVDGLITDRPDIMMKVLAKRERALSLGS